MTSRGRWSAGEIRALGTTTDVATAASVLGIGRSLAYELLRRDEFPVPVIRAATLVEHRLDSPARVRQAGATGVAQALGVAETEAETILAEVETWLQAKAQEVAVAAALAAGPAPEVSAEAAGKAAEGDETP